MKSPRPPSGGHRALIERFPNGVLVLFDADLYYRIVGPDSLPFSGRNASEMAGAHLSELFPEETVTELEPKLRATIEGTPQSFDSEYGDRIHHIETRPVHIDGEPYGVLVTQEVTDARQTATDLEEQNERLDQFASMLSHDLRNPLSIAVGELERYRETGDDAYLDGVEDALGRIDEIIVDLTTLARSNTPSEEHESVSLTEISRDAWELIDTQSASLETQDCTIEADRSQLQALFENLFRNAVGHGGMDVTVRVGPLEGGFFVEDTGDGIPPETKEQVFEYGFTTGYGGSGVGLTIVRRIAADHDLDVSLAESPEGGARFEFY
ncbi:sensor histidine kinase [Natrinema halophilum]|uniref:histidine kinase n=1 Tax=Natrinema halophilum TaxID=1699371 RepID=A0A7D5H0Q2_9EURY|nr:PAS domain-containing sensor histidine kinase [Natrinema halophilum]QLG47711.1 PAS domain-containing sensor histidine kinase [Natrinema halophilum]